MKRKEIALFMIVGTGYNVDADENGFKLLAKKLYSTIGKINPDFIVFFASRESKHTIDYIEELFLKDGDELIASQDYDIVLIEAIDNFNSCFEAFESKIWEFDIFDDEKDYRIIMDYTSGTKTMSAAMACCGMFYSKDLISVSGDRSTGEVSTGTEIINYQNLYKIYDRIAFSRVRSNFNSNRFMACIEILNTIVGSDFNKDLLLNLCKAYYSWDNMDFEAAYNYLREVDTDCLEFLDIKKDLNYNLGALGKIVHSRSPNLKNCYILASLINNAIAKADEYRYDDAIARLYRSLELIAQIRLTGYGLKSSDIDLSILEERSVSEDFVCELKNAEEDGKIRIGLSKDYLLLNELGDDLGKYYIENESKIKNLTQKRNHSILAHGLESQTKEDFDSFLELVLSLAKKLDKDMNKFLKETKFAKFDLKLKLNQV